MMKVCLMNLLNASLRFQGFDDMKVVGLSDDYSVARVNYFRGGVVVGKAAVPAETLLLVD